MPTFEEIYNNHADRYDALVRAEDWRGNLPALLHKTCDWSGKTVNEAGIGTCRVSRLYLDQAARMFGYDRSPHMLERATQNLAGWKEKIELAVLDNLKLAELTLRADLFIEGWAFGHTVYDGPVSVEENAQRLVDGCLGLLSPGGTAMIIETLSTNAEDPAPPTEELAEFYSLLERRHGFTRHEVRTDYRFASVEDAEAIMGFFFGKGMAEAVRQRGTATIPEWTGVWSRVKEG